MSLTRLEPDAADLVQDVFLLWAAKGHQLKDVSKVKAWLFTSLHRGFLQKHRRSTRFPHVEIASVEFELPTVDPGQLTSLNTQHLLELLARVDAQYQAPLALFYLEDYSYNEIAGILEVPLGTVKSRIARGLAQLKALVSRKTASPITARVRTSSGAADSANKVEPSAPEDGRTPTAAGGHP
jgi:RNA polymerase sigma-70 factor (ECF subfamily)